MTLQIQELFIYCILGSIVFLIVMPYAHEYGHYYSAKLLGRKTKLDMKKRQVWTDFDNDFQYFIVTISGIITGLIPLLFLPNGETIFVKVYFITVYLLYSCSSDDIKIMRVFCDYLHIYFPEWISNIERKLIIDKHHKYCNCVYCNDLRYENMFMFRS